MSNCSYGPNGVVPRDASFTTAFRSKNTVACSGRFSFLETNSATVNEELRARSLVDAQDVAYYGAVGDGVTDDTAAIQEALDSGLSPIVFDGAATYLVSALTVPAGTTLITNCATFEAITSGSTVATIALGDNTFVDCIRLNVAAGRTVRRPVQIVGDNVFVDKIHVTSVDQQANTASTFDNAVIITGSYVQVNRVQISNFDNNLQINNCTDVVINGVAITSYVLGIKIGSTPSTERVWINNASITVASPNALRTPGHNGINGQECSNIFLSNILVADSGEHGIYFTSYADMEHIYMDDVKVTNTGSCSIKLKADQNDGGTFYRFRHIHINNAVLTDANQTLNPCLLINRVIWSSFTNIICNSITKAKCGRSGIELAACTELFFDNIFIRNPAEDAFWARSTLIFSDTFLDGYYNISGIKLNSVYFSGVGAGFSNILIDYSGDATNSPSLSGFNATNINTIGGLYGVELLNTGGFGNITGRNMFNISSFGVFATGLVGGNGYDPQRVIVNDAPNTMYGYVGSDGTTGNNLPPGMTAARNALGVYTVTHNMDIVSANLGISAIANGTLARPHISASTGTTIQFTFTDDTATPVDTAFNFSVVRTASNFT